MRRSRKLIVFLWLVTFSDPLQSQDLTSPPQDRGYFKVEVKGDLKSKDPKIINELVGGYTIDADGKSYPLEIPEDRMLHFLAETLSGYQVLIKGRLKTGDKTAIVVERIEPATFPKIGEKKP